MQASTWILLPLLLLFVIIVINGNYYFNQSFWVFIAFLGAFNRLNETTRNPNRCPICISSSYTNCMPSWSFQVSCEYFQNCSATFVSGRPSIWSWASWYTQRRVLSRFFSSLLVASSYLLANDRPNILLKTSN
jgi:hypothetical protein